MASIFADRHHEGLWNSFELLFEKRLGHTLYHPWGMDWYTSKNWKIGDPYGEAGQYTAAQFLSGSIPQDGTEILHPRRGVSFEDFKTTPIDVIIASYYDHIALYTKLRDQFHPNAKIIVHYGNEWPIHPETKNLMASTAPMSVPPHINTVYYHQEFDTDLYHYGDEYRNQQQLATFCNAISQNDLFKQDWLDFQALESLLPNFVCRSFGGGCRNGSFGQQDCAETMRSLSYAIHFKEGGDGYGHVIHQLAATGTPIIFKGHQYRGKLAECLLEDGKTGFDMDLRGLDEIVEAIKSCPNDQRLSMGREIRRRFEYYVNFNIEQTLISNFLTHLL